MSMKSPLGGPADELVPEVPATELVEQIDKDVSRVSKASEDDRYAIRSILVGYAIHRPQVGYCQGMADVAYWIYSVLTARANIHQAHVMFTAISDQLIALYIEPLSLLNQQTELIDRYLRDHGMGSFFHLSHGSCAWVYHAWALRLYTQFPLPSTLRAIDGILEHGPIFAAALAAAIFESQRQSLSRQTTLEDLFAVMRAIPDGEIGDETFSRAVQIVHALDV